MWCVGFSATRDHGWVLGARDQLFCSRFDLESNLGRLPWQAGFSKPLHHEGSPMRGAFELNLA